VRLSVNLNSVFDDEPFVDRVGRAADAGAEAVGVFGRDPEELSMIADRVTDRGLDFAYASSLVGPINDPDAVEEHVAELEDAIELAADLGIENVNASPGRDIDGVDDATQFEATVEVLRRAVPVAADAGVTLLLEPLNVAVDHPGVWLSSSLEGYKLLTAVDSPRAKLLFDIYHQQITEGNVTSNLVEHVDHVGHVHVADVPGRAEPGTGELDYPSIVDALGAAGYEGYVECEFWPESDPEAAIDRMGRMISDAA
jgi:hydroxypyruvate isomerase